MIYRAKIPSRMHDILASVIVASSQAGVQKLEGSEADAGNSEACRSRYHNTIPAK